MTITLKEIYFNNGQLIPLLEVDKDSDILDGLNYELELEAVYIINLEYGCLENYNTLELITTIMKKYNKKYIDKNIWQQYLNDKYEEEINNKGICNLLRKPAYTIGYNSIKPLTKYNIKMPEENLEYLWTCSESLNDCHKVVFYKDNIIDKSDYSHTLLNIIFNCDISFKINICKTCQKPYITYTRNLEACHRIYINNITCNKYAEKIRKQHQFDDPIKHLIKNVRDKLKDNPTKLEEFNNILPNKRKEYYNDNKSFILWILDNYYYTAKGKESAIKRLGLSKYL